MKNFLKVCRFNFFFSLFFFWVVFVPVFLLKQKKKKILKFKNLKKQIGREQV